MCGECNICVNSCPANAIIGRNFRESESRNLRLKVKDCEEYIDRLKEINKLGVCGMCLYSCPFGSHI
jgi:epoxyqueuosine reductase QueG